MFRLNLGFSFVLMLVALLGTSISSLAQASEKSTGYNWNTSWVGSWSRGSCLSVAYHADHLYYADGALLRIAQAENPSQPVSMGAVLLPEEVVDIAVSGSLAFAACDESGLRILDVSNPAEPLEVGGSVTSFL